MTSIILASIAVPLMIVAATLMVDRIEQSAVNERTHEDESEKKRDERNDPPNDLIDLSGGMYGI